MSAALALHVNPQKYSPFLGVRASSPVRFGEAYAPGTRRLMLPLRLPRFFTTLHAWFVRYILRDPLYADLISGWHVKDGQEYYSLVAQRDKYRAKWHEWWKEQELDFLVTVPHAMPAMKHDGGELGTKACGYMFLFNVVSCTSA